MEYEAALEILENGDTASDDLLVDAAKTILKTENVDADHAVRATLVIGEVRARRWKVDTAKVLPLDDLTGIKFMVLRK
jgi:hypothetical protein